MSKVKITNKDVGRKFRTRDGRIFIITKYDKKDRIYPVNVEADGLENYSMVNCNNGTLRTSGEAFKGQVNNIDFKEWL